MAAVRAADSEEGADWRLCPARPVVYDAQYHYYAYGNTPPTYLFAGVGADRPEAHVLCIGSGDIRSTAYSLWRELRRARDLRVRFVLNDWEPCVVARNIVLLAMMRRGTSAEVLWGVWFSVGIPRTAREELDTVLQELLGRSDEALAADGIRFADQADSARVRRVWRVWAGWKDRPLEHYLRLRRAETGRHFERVAGSSDCAKAGKQQGWVRTAMYSVLAPGSPAEAIGDEFSAYVCTGISLPNDAATDLVFNQTLMQSEEKWTMHYGSVPYLAFPTFACDYAAKRPLFTVCFQQLRQWAGAVRRFPHVEWVFSAADGLALLTGASPEMQRPFDLIDTSNVADHASLISLLASARRVVSDRGFMTTQTLLHLNIAKDAAQYLRRCLVLPPETWPSAFGWRCEAFEGALAPESSAVQCDRMPDALALMLRKTSGCTSRSEVHFHWHPCPRNTIPPAIAGFGDLVRAYENDEPEFGLHTKHPGSLLPLLPYVCGEIGNAETADLLRLWRGAVSDGFVVASVPFPAEMFATTKTKEPQPVLRILLGNWTESAQFSSVWTSGTPADGGTTEVHWICQESLLDRAETVVIAGKFALIHTCPPSSVRRRKLGRGPPPPVVPTVELRAGLKDGDMKLAESCADFRLTVSPIPDAWWEPVQSGRALAVERGTDGQLLLGLKRAGKCGGVDLAQTVQLSCPVSVDKARLLLSRKRRSVEVVLPKRPFGTAWRQLTWTDDIANPLRKELAQVAVMQSGMQMSEEEKYVSRSRETLSVPPLVALKDTIICLFQRTEPQLQHITVGPSSVHAIVWHHGLRQEHCTGVIAADISICFLTVDMLDVFVPMWMELPPKVGRPTTICSEKEFELLKYFVSLFEKRMKDHPVHPALPKWARPNFRRVLVPPLFQKEAAAAADIGASAKAPGGFDNLDGDRLHCRKEMGNRLVAEGKFAEALQHYQAVLRPHDPKVKQPPSQLVLACSLNAAHCRLRLAEAAPVASEDRRKHAEEAVVAADGALKCAVEKSVGTSAHIGKAHFRRGMALELLGRSAEAQSAVRAALKLLPEDEGVKAAAARICASQPPAAVP